MLARVRAEHARELAEHTARQAERDRDLAERESALRAERMTLDLDVADKVRDERTRIATEERERAKAALATEIQGQANELAALRELAAEREAKLADAQQVQLALIRKQAELENEKRNLDMQRETDRKEVEQRIADARKQVERETEERLAQEREQIIAEQRAKLAADAEERSRLLVEDARRQKDAEVSQLNSLLKDRDEKLATAQAAQIEALRKSRELDDQKREMEIRLEQRILEQAAEIRERAAREAEDRLKLLMREKDESIADLKRSMEDLQHKFEKKSQQLQGEVQELDLEERLQRHFVRDHIAPIPKGQVGADVMQRVVGDSGVECGAIVWECKRTKNWQAVWLDKLRDDQRATKAELAILVSQTLPDGVDNFSFIDGIWVVHPSLVIPVATALRERLLEVSRTRQSMSGQQDKVQLVYGYLTSPQFKQRIEAIVEAFRTMQSDLQQERRVFERHWAKREKEIEHVIAATAGMCGDLQGIVGASFQEIDGLSMPLLEQAAIGA